MKINFPKLKKDRKRKIEVNHRIPSREIRRNACFKIKDTKNTIRVFQRGGRPSTKKKNQIGIIYIHRALHTLPPSPPPPVIQFSTSGTVNSHFLKSGLVSGTYHQ